MRRFFAAAMLAMAIVVGAGAPGLAGTVREDAEKLLFGGAAKGEPLRLVGRIVSWQGVGYMVDVDLLAAGASLETVATNRQLHLVLVLTDKPLGVRYGQRVSWLVRYDAPRYWNSGFGVFKVQGTRFASR